MKYAIGIVLAAAALVAVLFGYRAYEDQKTLNTIGLQVKTASLRLAGTLRYETEQGTQITYKELFERCDLEVGEIEKAILSIQTLANDRNQNIVQPSVAYLRGGQVLLRTLVSKYRAKLAFDAKTEALITAVKYQDARTLGLDYARKNMLSAKEAWDEANLKLESSKSDLISSANQMTALRSAAASVISADNLVDAALLVEMTKKPEKKEVDSKK